MEKEALARKRAEEDRIKREKLQGLVEMAGGICHELSQPMQVISGYAELLMADISEDNPLYGDIEEIKNHVVKMAQITKKLTRITRYETREYIEGIRIVHN